MPEAVERRAWDLFGFKLGIMELGMRFIEMHVQINEIIPIICTFTLNEPKKQYKVFSVMLKYPNFVEIYQFSSPFPKNLKCKNRENDFLVFKSCLLVWSFLPAIYLKSNSVQKSELFEI